MIIKFLKLNLEHFNHAQCRSIQTSYAARFAAQGMSGRKQNVPHKTLDQRNIQGRRKDTFNPNEAESRHSENPLDASWFQEGSILGTEGNPEKIGFLDQVGSQTATAEYFEGSDWQQEKGPCKIEGAATSGFTSTIRSAVGLGHNKENV